MVSEKISSPIDRYFKCFYEFKRDTYKKLLEEKSLLKTKNGNFQDRTDFFMRSLIDCFFLGGDYFEFGVYTGGSALFIAKFLEDANEISGRNVQLYLFDSFMGFPEISEHDLRHIKKGCFSCSYEDTKNYIDSNLKDSSFVHYKVGWIPETFVGLDSVNIAFAHFDVDLYQSYMDCFKYAYPKLLKNGIFLFDDAGDRDWPGATEAMHKFFSDKNDKPQVMKYTTFDNKIDEQWYYKK
jgi:hypothetical protein